MIPPRPLLPVGAELVAWALGRRARMRVEGRSMVPTLDDGDHVLVDPDRTPGPGLVVAARPAALGGRAVIKRVASMTADGSCVLASDNRAEGTDATRWGPVPPERIDGVVTVDLVKLRPLTSPPTSS